MHHSDGMKIKQRILCEIANKLLPNWKDRIIDTYLGKVPRKLNGTPVARHRWSVPSGAPPLVKFIVVTAADASGYQRLRKEGNRSKAKQSERNI